MSGASLASFATRSSFVETSTEVCVSAIFPSNGSVIRCRPLLGGVPRVGSPASSLLLRHSDFPPPVGRASLPSRRSLPRSHFASTRGDDGTSQVPGQPLSHVPCSLTPVEPLRRTFGPCLATGAAVLPSAFGNSVGLHNLRISGLNHTAHAPAVYASQPRSPVYSLRPRKTRFRLVVSLAGRDFHPRAAS